MDNIKNKLCALHVHRWGNPWSGYYKTIPLSKPQLKLLHKACETIDTKLLEGEEFESIRKTVSEELLKNPVLFFKISSISCKDVEGDDFGPAYKINSVPRLLHSLVYSFRIMDEIEDELELDTPPLDMGIGDELKVNTQNREKGFGDELKDIPPPDMGIGDELKVNTQNRGKGFGDELKDTPPPDMGIGDELKVNTQTRKKDFGDELKVNTQTRGKDFGDELKDTPLPPTRRKDDYTIALRPWDDKICLENEYRLLIVERQLEAVIKPSTGVLIVGEFYKVLEEFIKTHSETFPEPSLAMDVAVDVLKMDQITFIEFNPLDEELDTFGADLSLNSPTLLTLLKRESFRYWLY